MAINIKAKQFLFLAPARMEYVSNRCLHERYAPGHTTAASNNWSIDAVAEKDLVKKIGELVMLWYD